jgi:homoserine dehydrogenase
MDAANSIIYGKKPSKLIVQKRAEIKKIKNIDDMHTRYYVHFSTIDRPGVLAKIADLLGKHDISIASVVQKQRKKEHIVPIVMLTHMAREKDMQSALSKINKLSVVKKKTVLMRLES